MYSFYGINRCITVDSLQCMEGSMEGPTLKEEKYVDIEELLSESLSDKTMSDEKEDLVLEYLCQTISKTDNYDVIKQRAQNGDSYAYIQLASWHIANAKNIKDYCEAFRYASKAAKNEYAEAYYILGQLYYYGVGCEKNLHRAIKSFQFFVENVSTKNLLNDSVLYDAYLKLAEAEKRNGHYEKALNYYRILRGLDGKYADVLRECEEEIKELRNERTKNFVVAASSFVAVCGVVFVLAMFLGEGFWQKEESILARDEKEVVITETPSALEEKVEETIQIQDTITCFIVTEEIFQSYALQELEMQEVYSSSEYISKVGKDYGARNVVDYDSNTSWQEGAQDAGIGQSITFCLKEPAIVSGMRIENGKQTSEEDYYNNNRIAMFRIFGEEKVTIALEDVMGAQYIIFENPVMLDKVELKIQSVYSGYKYNDTCVSEITLYE